MDRCELNKMFDGLAPAPGREEELLEKLLQDDVRRNRPVKNWRRIVVAVAAAALLVTAATAAHNLGVSIVERDDGYFFAGGMTYYPAEQLSEELKAFEAVYTGDEVLMRTFLSWEEMEDFVGVDLMDNSLLDASPATAFHQEWVRGSQRAVGHFILEAYQGLTLVMTHSCYEIGDANIVVDSYLFTDRHERHMDDEAFFGLAGFQDGTEINWEACTTPGGRQVQALGIDRPSGSRTDDVCIGALSLNGIPTIVKVDSKEGVAEARRILMQVLDSFQ